MATDSHSERYEDKKKGVRGESGARNVSVFLALPIFFFDDGRVVGSLSLSRARIGLRGECVCTSLSVFRKGQRRRLERARKRRSLSDQFSFVAGSK